MGLGLKVAFVPIAIGILSHDIRSKKLYHIKKPNLYEVGFKSGVDLLSHDQNRSTISAIRLNFSVRNGKRWTMMQQTPKIVDDQKKDFQNKDYFVANKIFNTNIQYFSDKKSRKESFLFCLSFFYLIIDNCRIEVVVDGDYKSTGNQYHSALTLLSLHL